MSVFEKLRAVQMEIVATKDNYNSFGKYSYRSAESIMEAAKPVLDRHGLTLFVSDEVVSVGDRIYVKSTACLIADGTEPNSNDQTPGISVSGWAREADSRRGMDDSQLTGSTASYARKYALAALLLLDDNKDADSGNPADVGHGGGSVAPAENRGGGNGGLEAARERLVGRLGGLGVPAKAAVKFIQEELGFTGVSAIDNEPAIAQVLEWAETTYSGSPF